jgi:hypothetical protein
VAEAGASRVGGLADTNGGWRGGPLGADVMGLGGEEQYPQLRRVASAAVGGSGAEGGDDTNFWEDYSCENCPRREE